MTVEDARDQDETEMKAEAVEESGQESAEDKASEAEGSANGPEDVCEIPRSEFEELSKRAEERDRFLSELQRRHAEYLDDLDRLREERRTAETVGLRKFLGDFMPILDDFERALSSGREDHAALLEGLQLVSNQINMILERHGIKPISALGQPFDPRFHEAVLQAATSEVSPGTVLEELRRGYLLQEQVLRAAQVCVAKAEEETPEDKQGEQENPSE